MSETSTPVPDAASAPTPGVPAWVRHAIVWQVYPLGFCGAPLTRDDLGGEGYGGVQGENVVHRLGRITAWLDHLVSLGADVLLLNPIFDSVSHGYDTLDHDRIDPRLGSQADFDALVEACHARGVRIVLDGVFNHVSNRHPRVRRAIAEGPDGPEGGRIRWSGDSPWGFEGNADLVELNLSNPHVQDAIVRIMTTWLDRGIDGWRLDAMYSAGAAAWAPILRRVAEAHPEAWILGEVIHGDYAQIAAESGAASITQYELWKAIWSSLRDGNLFELTHALGRDEEFRAPVGGHELLPLTFLGNHDTTRIASQLPDGRDLVVAYALLALLPGIPAIYAGDEYGAVGVKEDRPGGDDAVRPRFPDDPSHAPGDLAVLSREAAPRILEVHRRLLGLRRRLPWLVDAHIEVEQSTLSDLFAELRLTSRTGEDSVRLLLNLADDDREVTGEILETVAGAAMLDDVPTAPGTVPAHGAVVVR